MVIFGSQLKETGAKYSSFCDLSPYCNQIAADVTDRHVMASSNFASFKTIA